MSMSTATVRNKETGVELHGTITSIECAANRDGSETGVVHLRLDGVRTRTHAFDLAEWDFTPDPEPLKDGYYTTGDTVISKRGDIVRIAYWRASISFPIHEVPKDARYIGPLDGDTA